MEFINTESELYKAFTMGAVYHRRSKLKNESPYGEGTKSAKAFELGYEYDFLVTQKESPIYWKDANQVGFIDN